MERIASALKDIPKTMYEMRQLRKDFPDTLQAVFQGEE
jgi:uncharacterized protein (UPF0216 family)